MNCDDAVSECRYDVNRRERVAGLARYVTRREGAPVSVGEARAGGETKVGKGSAGLL